jgi:hypothetical protein
MQPLAGLSSKKVCAIKGAPRELMNALIHDRICRRLLRLFFAIAAGFFALWTSVADAEQEQRTAALQVASGDLAAANALTKQIAALSPRVRTEEAARLAECAYVTVSQLRRQYRMFGTPIFNNFLIYHGIRKRGYCFQWAEDLLVALDALKLNSLELHWGESNVGNWRENNCIVVTPKGQPFNRGIVLDCWRHFGHLRWNAVTADEDPYVENKAYAQFVRAKSAPKAFGTNRHVAFQTTIKANRKSDD